MCRHTVKGLAVFFIMTVTSVHALPTDRQQVMQVAADSASLSQAEHRGEYKGNVEMIQGSSNLRAAYAETRADEKNHLSFAIAKGDNKNQAHYWTKTALDKPALHAFADIIRYYPQKNLIVLEGNARIEQGKNSFIAAKISYDTVNQNVLSESNQQQRTSITIYPEKKLS